MHTYAHPVDLLEDARKKRRDCVDDVALRSALPAGVDGIVEANDHRDLTAFARDVRGERTADDVDSVCAPLDGRDVHGGSKRGRCSSGDLEQTSIRGASRSTRQTLSPPRGASPCERARLFLRRGPGPRRVGAQLAPRAGTLEVHP
jgi:hypothetical protein